MFTTVSSSWKSNPFIQPESFPCHFTAVLVNHQPPLFPAVVAMPASSPPSSPRSSMSSSSSSADSFQSSAFHSPLTSPELRPAADSTTALILLPDDEDSIHAPFHFDDDDDENDGLNDDDEAFPIQDTARRSSLSAAVPPLSPSSIFLYLLSPYLSLGALLIPTSATPLKYGLSALLVFAALSAFVRQVWYMLARYMRTGSMEEVIVDAFARGRGKEGRRRAVRLCIRLGTGLLRVLVAAMYLQDATTTLLPLLPSPLPLPSWPLQTRPTITFLLALLILPFSLPNTLAAKRVLFATWLGILSFVVWLGCVVYAHSQGRLDGNPIWLGRGGLWESGCTY